MKKNDYKEAKEISDVISGGYFNFRIFEFTKNNETWYELREVYYTKDNKIWGWSDVAETIYFEGYQDMFQLMNNMLNASRETILKIEDGNIIDTGEILFKEEVK